MCTCYRFIFNAFCLKQSSCEVSKFLRSFSIFAFLSIGLLGIVIGEEGLRFKLRCFFGAVLPRREAEMDPATRYTLRRNVASIMKI